MNFKKKLFSVITAFAVAVSFAGCTPVNEAADSKDKDGYEEDSDRKFRDRNKDSSSDAESSSEIVEEKRVPTILDDLTELESWNPGKVNLRLDAKIAGVSSGSGSDSIYVTLDCAADIAENAETIGLNVKNLSFSDGGSQQIDLSGVDAVVTADKLYIGIDGMLALSAAGGSFPEGMTAEDLKAEFQKQYSGVEYFVMDGGLGDAGDYISSSVTTDLPEGVTPEDIKTWFETEAAPALEKSFADIGADMFSSSGDRRTITITNNNIPAFTKAVKGIISDGTFDKLVMSFAKLIGEQDSLDKEALSDMKEEIEDGLEEIDDVLKDSKINITVSTEIRGQTAVIEISAAIKTKLPDSDETADISVSLKAEVENGWAKVAIPDASKTMETDSF